jgi:3-oxoadipate enol-lactonase
MPKIRANGIQLYYELAGPREAPVVMLSNSLGTRLEMWDPQMQALTERYRVLRYDSRGHGRSDAPDGPYTIDLLADDALGLLDALGIRRVHFCGLSKGGMVGQVLGAQHGDRLITLALCSTSSHMPARELWQERIRIATEQGMVALADGVIERWFTEAFRHEPSITVDRVRQMILETPAHGYAACCAAIRDMDLRELIRGIRVPTLVMVGDKDPATPPKMAQEIQSRIPGARLEVVPDAAHLLNIEQDVVFDAALIALLDRHRA